MSSHLPGAALAVLAAALGTGAAAHEVTSPTSDKVAAPFDIVRTTIATEGADVVFRIAVRGDAGTDKPAAVGRFEGSGVYAYVWPTSLDTSLVGFEPEQGILALAVTFHPDFDDGAPGRVANRTVWHPHWVVLAPDEACGPEALKVKDIPAGTKPRLPATWPGAPILIDSPDYPLAIGGETVEVRVPAATLGAVTGTSFDGVTSALKVNANLHAPLLCVSDVFDVASGDLSLPGRAK